MREKHTKEAALSTSLALLAVIALHAGEIAKHLQHTQEVNRTPNQTVVIYDSHTPYPGTPEAQMIYATQFSVESAFLPTITPEETPDIEIDPTLLSLMGSLPESLFDMSEPFSTEQGAFDATKELGEK